MKTPQSVVDRATPNKKKYWNGQLHPLICWVFPELVVGGRLNLNVLAGELGYCYYTLLKAFQSDTLSVGVAKAMIQYAEKMNRRLEKENILDYLLR